MEKLEWKIRSAARKFRKSRSDYYEFVASLLRSSNGGIKFIEIFENDAMRYHGTPRGVLANHWYEQYAANGGNLADAMQGTLPEDEVAIIRVSQNSGGDAIVTAFEDLARISKLSDKVKSESFGTVAAGAVALVIAMTMSTVFPVISAKELQSTYSFLPFDAWGPTGRSYVRYAEFIAANWFYLLAFFVTLIAGLVWSLPNYVQHPDVREWLDEKVVLYRIARDLKGAMFLSMMATLTRKRAGVMFTLKQSLEMFLESARTPWLRWRVGQVIEGADETGAIGVSAFNTGFISKEMFFFLEDMQKAKGFADGFEATAAHIETSMLASIIRRMSVYRWAMLFVGLGIVMYMFTWLFRVIYEMRGAMSAFLATN